MQPILLGGKSVIASSCSLLAAAKSLAVNPNDAATWQQIAAQAKALGEAVRTLITALKYVGCFEYSGTSLLRTLWDLNFSPYYRSFLNSEVI